MNTNVASVFYACRSVGRQMLERRSDKVINISSISAHLVGPGGAPYETSKAALNMLTKVVTTERAAYAVNVNAILPGWFVTEMTRAGYEKPEVKVYEVFDPV